MSDLVALSPVPFESLRAGALAPRTSAIKDQVWGLVDTSKPNADRSLDELKRLLEQDFAASGFVHYRKAAPGVPLSAEQLATLAAKCRFVVIAFGD
jgi:hypothetical protein